MTTATEKHYRPAEIAEMWGVGTNTVRRLFEDVPGVLRISQPTEVRRKHAPHVMLLIPASVLESAYKQWSVRRVREVKRGNR